jgi:sugar/nucleoside kinase (ribokinase family)
MSTCWDILGLGCVAVDDLIYLDAFPRPDSKARIHERQRQCGGQTGNALVAAARLGARCAFAGTLGDDEASRFVIEALEREQIDLAPLRRLDAARPIRSTILVDLSTGSRTVLYDLKGSLPATPDWPPQETVRQARVLFIDQYGVEGMLRAARTARAAGHAVVADFDGGDLPDFDQLCSLVDHLIIDAALAQHLTDCSDPAASALRLWTGNRQVVVVTCGAAGSWWVSVDQQTPVHQPAPAVPVVDTTGCGDVFRGAYMTALVRGLPPAERVGLASAAAALKATRPGGQLGCPTWVELQEFLRKLDACRNEPEA